MSANQKIGIAEASRLRRALSRLARELNDSATGEGLTPSQASALAVVVSRSPIGVSELIEIERVNPTMLSRVIGKLEAAGYVRRFPAANDQRAVMVEATADGRNVNDRILRQRTARLLVSIGRLSDGHAVALGGAVDALEALVEQINEQHQ